MSFVRIEKEKYISRCVGRKSGKEFTKTRFKKKYIFRCTRCAVEFVRKSHPQEYIKREIHFCSNKCVNQSQIDGVIKDKKEQYFMDKYGVKNSCQAEEVKQKMRESNIEKYGYESHMQNPECYEKYKERMVELHGVENIFQTEECKDKIKETLQDRYGVNTGWMVEDDNGIPKRQQTCIERYGVRNPMQSEEVRGRRPDMSGPNHPSWKGGTSGISHLIYADHTLYTQWKLPILKHDNFTCTSCGSTSNLHVHHDDVMMSQIIHEHKDSYPDYNDDDFSHKKQIASNVVNHHIDNAISGITLCESCHKNVHNNLNF